MEGLGEPMFDGVAEFGFDDMDMFQKWFAWFMSDGGQPLRDDEKNFMDSSAARRRHGGGESHHSGR